MIRLALPNDADAIRELVRAAYERWIVRLGREPSPMQDDYAQSIADGQAWVLKRAISPQEREIVGLVVLKNDPVALLISNIAVVPTAQGQGYGRQLIAFAEQETRRRGYDEIRLYANTLMTENIALYQHLGFREIARIEGKERDRNYLLMAKPVP